MLAAVTALGVSSAVLCAHRGLAAPLELTLADRGAANYAIVGPASPTKVDAYAARELAGYLKQITGADFPVVDPDDRGEDKNTIFVGLSASALEHLGEEALAGLLDQEHVARSIGQDIFLYGKGMHGNLYAVMEFLEKSLGWRWYSIFEHPVIPSKPAVVLKPFNRRKVFSFAFRKINVHRGMDFPYIHGINQGISARARDILRRSANPNDDRFAHFVSRKPEFGRGHSLHLYIPPTPGSKGKHTYDWLAKRNYFETNPEFFSMWTVGKRVPNKQLCFSNAALRKELTKNVLRHIERAGEDVMLTVAANDHPGKFCYCPECAKLEEKYQSPGGPIYDYLIELCNLLATKHPQVLIKTLAYRRSQTQKPPILPEGKRLPENLVIDFAPIEDCYFADWTHPDPGIQETYNDLLSWGRIATHLWAWLYPNPWGSGITMPVGNVDRVITNMRLMHRAGVSGVFTDHCNFHQRGGWSELQQYLFLKLMRDIDCDTDALIEAFTDNLYGPAGPLMRTYLAELEQGRKAMAELPPGVTYRSSDYNERTFPYLTVANIHRWQTLFDRMEELVAGETERLKINVRLVRRELDLATLWKWFDLKKAYPDYFKDHTVHSDRVAAVNKAKPQPPMGDGTANRTEWEKKTAKGTNRQAKPLGNSVLKDFLTLIEAGGQEKPLPPEFDGIDRSRIRTFVPQYPNRRRGRAIIHDPDAAFGYAVPVTMPDLPFNFGFYQNDTRTHGVRRVLEAGEIKLDAYRTYKLGMIDVTPACQIWFSAKSWQTNLKLGERLFEPGADNHWEAYVSLKFGGPTYGNNVDESLMAPAELTNYGDYRRGEKGKDLVLVDRIVLVKHTEQ